MSFMSVFSLSVTPLTESWARELGGDLSTPTPIEVELRAHLEEPGLQNLQRRQPSAP
jgi:hypothetical protein